MRIKTISFMIIALSIVSACSNVSDLPNTQRLSTQATNQQYFYCESCAKPTLLNYQVYKPLEPDSPIVEVKPLVQQVLYVAPKHVKHKKNHKRRVRRNRTKQCLNWSYK